MAITAGLDISDAIGLFEVLDSDSTGAIDAWVRSSMAGKQGKSW